MDELVWVLGHERQVLESLLFRLLEARGLLATGETRFLGWAAADVERSAEAVREIELRRATITVGPEPFHAATLRELAASSPEPFASLFADHRVALARLAVEVGAAIETVQEMAQDALVRLGSPEPDALATCGGHLGTRAPSGAPRRNGRRDDHTPVQERRVTATDDLDPLDREIAAASYEAIIRASDRLALPALVSFLS